MSLNLFMLKTHSLELAKLANYRICLSFLSYWLNTILVCLMR